jgi:hypothetical protein
MTIRKHIARIVVGCVLAAIAAAPAYSGSGRPASMSPQEYAALMARSEVSNVLYGLGKPVGMTHEQYRAELIRDAALNERYGLPVALGSDETARLYGTRAQTREVAAPPEPAAVAPSDGFDWADAAIGVGFAAGLFVLAAAGALTVRRHGRIGHAHR